MTRSTVSSRRSARGAINRVVVGFIVTLAMVMVLGGCASAGPRTPRIIGSATLEPFVRIDFESDRWPAAISEPRRNERAVIVGDPDDPRNRVLRVTFAQGSHLAATLYIPLADRLGREPHEAMVRYRLRFDPAWRTPSGGKLPGFGGTYNRAGWGGRPSDGYNGWSARGMFFPTTEDGRIPIGSYLYHPGLRETQPNSTSGEGINYHRLARLPGLERGRWYTVEQHLRLNTLDPEPSKGNGGPGRADGVLRAWIDGRLVFERENIVFRHTDGLQIERIWLDFYHGGALTAPMDLILWIDDIEVQTAYPAR